jgi:glucose/arabinose dehydrogenase
MRRHIARYEHLWLAAGVAWILANLVACSGPAALSIEAGTGPHPVLPPAQHALIPNINVAKAVGWRIGATPTPAAGTVVTPFATGLEHPRWIYVLPNGDVLVAETNAPVRPDDAKGIRGWFFKHFQKRGGGTAPTANRITLLRDTNGDGVVDVRTVFLSELSSPFGMALIGNTLYIANSDAIVRFPYVAGQTTITAAPTTLCDLPAGTVNHHWTKSLLASSDGATLYVGVGSNSNAAENGMEIEAERSSVWAVDVAKGTHRIFASGLRNPVGMAWEPTSGALWVVVNERDELGSDLVPDYMTALREGAFYGWPYSYFGAHVDTRVKPARPALVATAIAPDYALGPHTASLGLAASTGTTLPPPFQNGMFVGQHGSWNRTPRSGNKVVFVPFVNGVPSGMPFDVLTGFLAQNGDAMGRPVGVAIDARGALLVADDVGNTIWRVAARGSPRR